jgi:hypothetical protein
MIYDALDLSATDFAQIGEIVLIADVPFSADEARRFADLRSADNIPIHDAARAAAGFVREFCGKRTGTKLPSFHERMREAEIRLAERRAKRTI